MTIVPKDLNETNEGYGSTVAPYAWQASMKVLFGGGGFPGLVEYFESGNYQMVIKDAKERLRSYKSPDKLSSMNEFELAHFYYLGEAYYKLGEVENAVGCFHVVLSQTGFTNHMKTSPVHFSDYVEKAERRLIEIASTKGEDFVNNYDVNTFFTSTMKSGCFIATATFQSPFAPEVITLRRFRDDVLERSIFGRIFIQVYYFVSPFVASIISSSGLLRTASRIFLSRFVSILDRSQIK